MRRPLAFLAAALCTLGLPAARAVPVTPGFASPNVEWVANVPLHADSAGARIVDGFLFASDSRQITIYDISNPELPVPVSETPLPEVPYFAQEDIETNGRILVIGQGRDTFNPTDLLWVYDVTDKRLPRLVATLRGASSHTISCVLDCQYLYNSNGQIVDLREPGTPKVVGKWGPGGHDVTEVARGLVVTSSNPVLYLDARRDPVHPKVLTKGRPGDDRFVHANLWPNAGRDRWLLVGGETAPDGTGGCADKDSGAFMVWDTKDWARTKSFRLVDEWRPPDSLPNEGGFPVATYCTHWFTTRPGYRNGGLVAEGWYEHGTRFLNVSTKGRIAEKGWFIPAGTTSSAAYWVTKDLLYVFDYNRGLDIVRWHDKPGSFPARPGHGLLPTVAPLFTRPLRPAFGAYCPVPA
ncbi:MAG TPA: hypothetical protein VFQ85_08695 [Mycobacteriales bacterium]|jgi:hypothetical protein|nr:hypothetical protein [Mycobacteriales bacterium]